MERGGVMRVNIRNVAMVAGALALCAVGAAAALANGTTSELTTTPATTTRPVQNVPMFSVQTQQAARTDTEKEDGDETTVEHRSDQQQTRSVTTTTQATVTGEDAQG